MSKIEKFMTQDLDLLDYVYTPYIKHKKFLYHMSIYGYTYVTKPHITGTLHPVYWFNKKHRFYIKPMTQKDYSISLFDYDKNKVVDFLRNNDLFSLDIETLDKNFRLNKDNNVVHKNIKKKPYILDLKVKDDIKHILITNAEKNANFNPYLADVVMIGLYSEKEYLMLKLDEPKQFKELIKLIEGKQIIIHNCHFELKFIRAYSTLDGYRKFIETNKIIDTMLLSIMVNTSDTKQHGLKVLAFSYSGDEYEEKGNFYDKVYLLKDIYYTYMLYTKVFKPLEDIDMYKTLVDLNLYMFASKNIKLSIDKNALTKNINDLYHLVKYYRDVVCVNYATPFQFMDYLKTEHNIIISDTNKDTINKLAKQYDFECIQNYKTLTKLKCVYGAIKPLCYKIAIVTYNFTLSTGRLSTNTPNLQGLSDKPILIQVDEKLNKYLQDNNITLENKVIDNVLHITPSKLILKNFYGVDYGQLETCVAAEMYDLKNFKDTINNKISMHDKTASLISANKYTVEQIKANKDNKNSEEYVLRQVAKVFNFGLLYGMGLSTLQATLANVDPSLVEEYYNNFITYDEDMKKLIDEKDGIAFNNSIFINKTVTYIDQLIPYICLTTPSGRNRIFCELYDYKNYINNKVINYVIQSYASDLNIKSMVAFLKNNPDVDFEGLIHDACYINSSEHLETLSKTMLETAMTLIPDINFTTDY